MLLHPWLLAGLAGASLPILIHLIGRRRAPTVRFAAFDFLMAINERLARRERLRQLLLLLLRTLAIIALVLAVARPVPIRSAAAPAVSRRLAIVLDASLSMGYVRDGRTLLERGKRLARETLSHLQPGDAATLVVAGREVHPVFQTPTLDLAAVRGALERIEQPEGVADLGAAIDAALAQLGGDGSGATLVVISDLSQNSFEGLRPTAMDPPPEVRLIDAAERESPAALGNVAIERVTVERTGEAASERRIKVLLRNYGAEAVADRPMELSLDGVVTQRGFVSIEPRGSEEKTLTHTFDGTGIFHGTVRLAAAENGYGADDSMSFVVDVAPGVRVLAVNGDPRTVPYEDELFFLERALQAVPRGEPPIELRIVSRDELLDPNAGVSFEGVDVVLLANVGELPEGAVAQLRRFVAGGGGLLFTLGEQVDFERANQSYGDLLPHTLRDLHKAADEVAGTPPLGVTDVDWDHPILAGLGAAVEESLRASRTSRYFNVDVGAAVRALPLLRFDNGAPALLERRAAGDGRVMLLTTSVDVDLSDLALRSAFPPLVQRSVRYLARAVSGAGVEPMRVGQEVEIPVPTGAQALALVSPNGKRLEVDTGDTSRRRARFGPLGELGIYSAEARQPEWTRVPRLDVAVNQSLLESDFMPVSAERVAEALGGGEDERTVAVTVGTGQYGDPFEQRGWATYLLLGLCLLFISESLLASRG